MSTQLPDDAVLLDLLAKRATEGLTAEEAAQLEALLRANPGVSADEFAPAVAALDVAARSRDTLPPNLRAKILA